MNSEEVKSLLENLNCDLPKIVQQKAISSLKK